jgi:hypothetical protein
MRDEVGVASRLVRNAASCFDLKTRWAEIGGAAGVDPGDSVFQGLPGGGVDLPGQSQLRGGGPGEFGLDDAVDPAGSGDRGRDRGRWPSGLAAGQGSGQLGQGPGGLGQGLVEAAGLFGV